MTNQQQQERFLPFTDCMNFRHMGNYPTVDGRVTRGDRLFRSCIFELDSAIDRERFQQLNIHNVFDFRMPTERERRPLVLDMLNTPPEVIELDIAPGSMGDYLTGLNGQQPAEGAIGQRMAGWYAEMPVAARQQYQKLFNHLGTCEGGILVLCNTGKDRSGMAAGLILAALGVDESNIEWDFMLSAWAYRDVNLAMKRYLGSHPLSADTAYMKEVFTVYPYYLDAFRSSAAELAGSLERFLENTLGVDANQRALLQGKYTEPTAIGPKGR